MSRLRENWRGYLAVALFIGAWFTVVYNVAPWRTRQPSIGDETATAAAAVLAKASDAHGICYGWYLENGEGFRSGRGGGLVESEAGSNLGPWTAIHNVEGRCTDYMEINVDVEYKGRNSATFTVLTNRTMLGPERPEDVLRRLGFDESAFLYDPAGNTIRAAEALPYVAAELGQASDLPGSPPRATHGLIRIPGFLILAVVAVVGIFVLGYFQRRNWSLKARPATGPAPDGPPPTGPPRSAARDGAGLRNRRRFTTRVRPADALRQRAARDRPDY